MAGFGQVLQEEDGMPRRVRCLTRSSRVPSLGNAIVEPELGPFLWFLNELTDGAVLRFIYRFKQP